MNSTIAGTIIRLMFIITLLTITYTGFTNHLMPFIERVSVQRMNNLYEWPYKGE